MAMLGTLSAEMACLGQHRSIETSKLSAHNYRASPLTLPNRDRPVKPAENNVRLLERTSPSFPLPILE